jgi:epoxyqueuosine reductase
MYATTPGPEALAQQIKERAAALGFTMAGVVAARPGRRLAAYHRWLANEYHGQMGYMARPDRTARREELNVILPGVRSILCVGLDYGGLPLPAALADDPGRGRISNYAWGQDYHDIMTPRLEELARWLVSAAGPNAGAACKVYVDTGAILERDHGETAGLGFTGKNTMLIDPRRGSWFFLGELLTTVKLAPDPQAAMPSCGTCRRCLDACPTAAFPEPYVLDARRCISYLTIELKGWVPGELRPLMGNWVYGCDVCQAVCPFNRFARPAAEAAFRPDDWDRVAPPLPALLALDQAAFDEQYGRSPIGRIGRDRLVRNACIAAGNWGSEAAVPLLIDLLADNSPLVRGHAAWALGRIGRPEGLAAVAAALQVETDPEVRAEMAAV